MTYIFDDLCCDFLSTFLYIHTMAPQDINEQIRFIEQRIEIWNGSTKLHVYMREMYQSILETLHLAQSMAIA